MSKHQKIVGVLVGIVMLMEGILIMFYPTETYFLILLILGFGFLSTGIGTLYYFFSMSRFMVGGKVSLYKGVILIDFALLTFSLTDVPRIYILIYLAAIHAFTGLVEILRTSEIKKSGSKRFILKFFHGFLNITMAFCCIIFAKKTGTASLIYGLGLFYSAIIRIITAFRKNTFVYIR